MNATGDVELPDVDVAELLDVDGEGNVWGPWRPPRHVRVLSLGEVALPSRLSVYDPSSDHSAVIPFAFAPGPHELAVVYDPRYRLGVDGSGAYVTHASMLRRSGAHVARWSLVYESDDDSVLVAAPGDEAAYEQVDPHPELLMERGRSPGGDAVVIENPTGNGIVAHVGLDDAGNAAALFLEHH